MDYHIQERDDHAVVYLSGELDMSVGEKVGNLLREVGARNQTISIDFRDVTFVDSSGIGSLFHTTKDLLGDGKHVEIVNVQEDILDILQVLGFAEALGIELKQA